MFSTLQLSGRFFFVWEQCNLICFKKNLILSLLLTTTFQEEIRFHALWQIPQSAIDPFYSGMGLCGLSYCYSWNQPRYGWWLLLWWYNFSVSLTPTGLCVMIAIYASFLSAMAVHSWWFYFSRCVEWNYIGQILSYHIIWCWRLRALYCLDSPGPLTAPTHSWPPLVESSFISPTWVWAMECLSAVVHWRWLWWSWSLTWLLNCF